MNDVVVARPTREVVATPVRAEARRPRRPIVQALERTIRHPMGAFGAVGVLLMVLVALGAPLIAPYDPAEQHSGLELKPPSAQFWLGTDRLGRDLLSRIIFGAQASLTVGVLAVAIGGIVGITTGLLAGYLGG